MRRALVIVTLALTAAGLGSSASESRPAVAPPSHPLQTAVDDPETFATPGADLAFQRTRAAGATFIRLTLRWFQVAPQRPVDPTNPADPAYQWDAFDNQVKLAVSNELQPLVTIEDAPAWAHGTPPSGSWPPKLVSYWNVDAVELGNFALAAARRYSGAFNGLPRVRYWQVWNEPNLSLFLNPQLSNQLTTTPTYPFNPDEIVSTDLYRDMVNSMYAAVHQARPDNRVIAGGTSPFTASDGVVAIGPLLFMRKLLCMSNDATPKPVCDKPIHFDIWSTHPYTAGGPTRGGLLPDDVSIGDLPRMDRLLRAAVAAHRVLSSGPVDFWVTEFSWDTTPPDCCAVPLSLHKRWVAEALYRMWLAGVSLVAWFEIRDQAPNERPDKGMQSGLYFRGETLAGDRPKPSLAAFAFPLVAFRSGNGIQVWGRTPWGKPGSVLVEQSSATGWKLLARLRTDKYGIFQGVLRPRSSSGLLVRARLVGGTTTTVPFSLKSPPELRVNPFGGPVTCNTCG